ncbi:uncharacterized protein LOC120655526 isoform X1 [Panicum virgatum]|nr:uncharacterized protein LOC120655526 isoform X1 [Panicum virgatum]XP_039789311.1 uncharacterized protein LOC120655526 isoform X1 [Panicum virgatum]
MASDTELGFTAQYGFLRMEDIYLNYDILESILNGGSDPTNLPLQFLSYITKNFSKERKIGSGGFGEVYMGMLKNRIVAVKRLFSDKTIREESFHREVDNLMTVKHQNIVQFLGFCANTENIPIKDPESEDYVKYIYVEKRERLLCFEYMSNGSLRRHLTDELRGLGWQTRYKIIKNICDGLRYLHEEIHMIHRDLKPENILLDDSMAPKLADLGISKLLNDDASKAITTNTQMSRGYCAPEFMKHYEVSFKTDIYSLGIIIIELVTGRKEHPDIKNVLRRWRYRWKKEKETTLSYQEVAKCVEIGQKCTEEDPRKRPSISNIINDLNMSDNENWQINNPREPTIGQIIPNWNELLLIEPPELHFPFERNKQISCSLQLINKKDSYIAFNIQTLSPLHYLPEPKSGIVPPLSNCTVKISLQKAPQHKQHANMFNVQSTKVNKDLTDENITECMFNVDAVEVVDEVTLTVVYDVPPLLELDRDRGNLNRPEAPNLPIIEAVSKTSSLATDELIQVYPKEFIFPLEPKEVEYTMTIVNVTDDWVAFYIGMKHVTAKYFSFDGNGILLPQTKLKIDYRRVPHKVVPANVRAKESAIVYSTIVCPGFKSHNVTADLFKDPTNGRLVQKVELPMFFAARHGIQPWEVMPYAIPSVSPASKQDFSKPTEINSQIRTPSSIKLIHVDPMEFSLPLEPKRVKFLMKILNITDNYVAFLIRYTRDKVDQYESTPQEGILPPRSMLVVENTRISQEGEHEDVQGHEFVYVDSTVVTKSFRISEITYDLFDVPSADRLQHEVKLPVFLVASGESKSWEVTSSAFPVSKQNIEKEFDRLQLTTDDQDDKNSLCKSGLTWLNTIDVHPTEPWIITTQDDLYVRIWNYETQIRTSTTIKLIEVFPLEFRWPLEKKEVRFLMSIENITDDYVAFLFRYTINKVHHYEACPQKGLLLPRSKFIVVHTIISQEGQPEDLHDKGFIYVDSTVVNKSFKTSEIKPDLFDVPPADRLLHGMKLPVYLVRSSETQSKEITDAQDDHNIQQEFNRLQLSTGEQDDQNSQSESGLTWVNSIDVHPTEPWIMTTQHDRYVRIWNYETQQVRRFLPGGSQVTSVKFIAHGHLILAASSDGLIYLYSYDPLKQIRVLRAHSASINCLAIHATEPYVLSASSDGQVQLRDYEKGMVLNKSFSVIPCGGPCLAFDPSGKSFASACGDSIKISNLHDDVCKILLRGHSREVTCLEYFAHRETTYLISGSEDGTAKIWDCKKGHCVKTLQVFSPVRTVCSHPVLPVLIIGSYDGSVRVWNSTTFRRERRIKLGLKGLSAIACLMGSTRIVIGHYNGLALAEIGREEPKAL